VIDPETSVLHVFAPARYGGLERVVTALVAAQARTVRRASVLAVVEPGDPHPVVEAIRNEGVDAEVLTVPPRQYFAERRGVLAACRRMKPEVVHVHGARPDVLVGPLLAREGYLTVSTVHGFTGGDFRNRVYERLQRRALRRATAVVAVSRPLQQELAQSGIAPDRIHLVPNAAPPHAAPLSRDQARRALGLTASGFAVAWVGRLTREKGCDLFIDALALLDGPPIAAAVIGSGVEATSLKQQAAAAGVGARIQWLGEVLSAGRMLAAFDLLVISSRTEGTPMVLFEAIQAGVPVVTTAVGGIPDVVSSDEAFVVAAPDARELAAAMRSAVNDTADGQRRAERARSRIAAEFGVGEWVARYTHVYDAARARARS
jgi:glycosyltransferase involved in cell wall biosynthesis